jgi:alkanesulfonate monooxygenase SsuD/methylene tetrahydromethanopterin reductase-like flavin-dependent oxidoreductase (luciferase family)
MELCFGINILQNLPYAELVKRWQQVETLGYDSLWIADHFYLRFSPEGMWFDGWTLLAAMAETTNDIRIGTAVTSPTLHNPAMLAKRAMTIDHISRGRLKLGIGSGGTGAVQEEEMIGAPTRSRSQRVERFGEFVELVDRLLRNNKTSYHGRYYETKEAMMAPGTVQEPRPPLTIAAHGPKSLRIAARYADTWNTYGKAQVTEEENLRAVREQSEMLDEYCAELGRDPQEIRRSFYAFLGGHRFAASTDAFQEFVGKYREVGFTEFILTWLPDDASGMAGEGAITSYETLEQIATEAIPSLRSE